MSEKREQLEKKINKLPLVHRIMINVDMSEFRNLTDSEFVDLMNYHRALAAENLEEKIIEQRGQINKLIKENRIMKKIMVNIDVTL